MNNFRYSFIDSYEDHPAVDESEAKNETNIETKSEAKSEKSSTKTKNESKKVQ